MTYTVIHTYGGLVFSEFVWAGTKHSECRCPVHFKKTVLVHGCSFGIRNTSPQLLDAMVIYEFVSLICPVTRSNFAVNPGALNTFWRSAENFQTDATYSWHHGWTPRRCSSIVCRMCRHASTANHLHTYNILHLQTAIKHERVQTDKHEQIHIYIWYIET